MKKFVFLILFSLSSFVWAKPLSLQGTLFEHAGIEYGVDPYLLYAVALAESAYRNENDGFISPYPWTLRTEKPYYGKTQKEAEDELKRVLKRTLSVDVGLMQINVRWHGHRVRNPIELLNPITNVKVGAQILKEALMSSPDDLITGIGRFHSYDPDKTERYGQTVYEIYKSIRSKNSK